MLDFLLYSVFLAFGWFIGGFEVGNVLLPLFFALPFTKKLEKAKLIKNKKKITILISYSVILNILSCVVISIGVYFLARSYFPCYCFGIILAIPNLLRSCSKSSELYIENVKDYLMAYADCLNDIPQDIVTLFNILYN